MMYFRLLNNNNDNSQASFSGEVILFTALPKYTKNTSSLSQDDCNVSLRQGLNTGR